VYIQAKVANAALVAYFCQETTNQLGWTSLDNPNFTVRPLPPAGLLQPTKARRGAAVWAWNAATETYMSGFLCSTSKTQQSLVLCKGGFDHVKESHNHVSPLVATVGRKATLLMYTNGQSR
jgi:hypothetical protein